MESRPTVFPIFGAVEDLFLAILSEFFKDHPDVHIYDQYSEDMELPAVIPLSANRSGMVAYQTSEDRWMRSGIIELNTIASGNDREIVNAQLQEACRHAIFEAWYHQRDYANHGSISTVSNSNYARPESDWATTSHAVQYAKLPAGASRYEARYRVLVRPSRTYDNPFLSKNPGRNIPAPEIS